MAYDDVDAGSTMGVAGGVVFDLDGVLQAKVRATDWHHRAGVPRSVRVAVCESVVTLV